MSNFSRPDPERKSFWQFQSATPNTQGAMVATFRHAIMNFGEVSLTEGVVYPNTKSFTLAELEDIINAPLHPQSPKSPDPKRVRQEQEKNRLIVNLARAALTSGEFNKAVKALGGAIPVQKTDTYVVPTEERVLAAA